jgi:DNA primase
VVDKHSIADYLRHIGAAVPAEGHGWRKIKCPFHNDSHASAGINFEENRFKCHACGVGGDVYDLIIYKEGGTYREAIKFAQTISLAGNAPVRQSDSSSNRVSVNTQSLGRRGATLSSWSGKGRSSRS